MSALIEHRGPDDFGYLFANTRTGETTVTQTVADDVAADLFLCSRRLAITDLRASARQPMCNAEQDRFVVFNGAIHNFVDLRDDLIKLGHRFVTGADTEVIIKAYDEWGPMCVQRFNGMWAFLLWDRRHRRLLVSRDRFGIKPLFVASVGDTHYFASEAKAIAAIEPATRQPNLSFIKHSIINLTSFDDKYTHFQGIELAPAAHNRVLTASGEKTERYWHYDHLSDDYDFNEPQGTFKALFDDAVRLRLIGDVPVSMLLSGGLDSSTLAMSLRRVAPERLKAFSARFEGFSQDESAYAISAARHAEIPIEFVDYRPKQLLDEMASVTWHLDAPVTKGQILARWQLIEQASQASTILLEGQGADELLGGYPGRYFWSYFRSELDDLRPASLLPGLGRIFSSFRVREHRQILNRRFRTKFPSLARSMPPDHQASAMRVLSPGLDEKGAIQQAKAVLAGSRLHAKLQQDHAHALLPHLLRFGDAISMAHSMESRLPFLDHRLVEFVFALPFQQMMSGRRNKVILRDALGPSLPADVRNRRDKVGFATPTSSWLRTRFDDEVRGVLSSTRIKEREVFDAEGLRNLVDQFDRLGTGHPLLLRCLGVEMWYRTFIDGEGYRNADRYDPADSGSVKLDS